MGEELDDLERRAADGDPSALTALAKHALVGRAGARSAEDGYRLLATAAEAGDAEADAMIAVLVGIDAQSDADWDRAFEYLGRAAARGLPSARAQLAVFCPDRSLAAASAAPSPPPAIWRQMKDKIDVAEVTRIPRAKIIRQQPYIAVVEGFASAAECAWMIGRAQPHLGRARIFDRQGSGASYAASRTNSAMQFDLLKTDLVLIVLQARIAAAADLAVRCLEETNILHYAVGQEFSQHYDFFTPGTPEFRHEMAVCGQRVATLLVYLNDDFAGGEISFESIGWRYRGGVGDALLFRNVLPSGEPDLETLHAGLPPTSGEKWLLSQWIRAHPPRREGALPANV